MTQTSPWQVCVWSFTSSALRRSIGIQTDLMTLPFVVQTRVQWADTDAAGVVWMGHFLRFCELAEDELFRATGETRQSLSARFDIFMPRTEASLQFCSPARPGDLLDVSVSVEVVNDRRIRYSFRIAQSDSRTVVATVTYVVACVTRDTFLPCAFPPELQAQIVTSS